MRLKIFFLLSLFLLPFAAGAATPSSVAVNIAPENPAPGEEVVITLSSYANNLDSVPITWSVSGMATSGGTGKKTFITKAPDAGKELRITAKLSLPEGELEKVVILRPSVMALLWQANDSYVPPFYRGRALPAVQGEIKIVAIPEIRSAGTTVNPKNLVYAWQRDYVNEPSASGYGKNFYVFAHDYLKGINNVRVTASTTDSKYFSAGDLGVQVFDPKILFYKVDSALGTLWENALADGHIVEGEEVIYAAPYFISPADIRIPSLIWAWSINGEYVNIGGLHKNMFPVQAQDGASGTSKIKLELTNKYKLLTSAAKEINVEF